MRKALVLGVSGQDGSYLAQLLLGKGYTVVGGSRDAETNAFQNLVRLGIRDRVETLSIRLDDHRELAGVLDCIAPDEIYNLAGQSSVGQSFQQPLETIESIATGTLHLLEAVRRRGARVKLYNAGSLECFGECSAGPADESTPLQPLSPYAVAKAAAFWELANYRTTYGLYACTGILGNHESPLRPARFVTRKVVAAACRIAAGSTERLPLGDLSVVRDWGFAPDYVEAIWLMLQQERADDYVIATGRSYRLEEFVATAFAVVGLDWRKHVSIDPALTRPNEVKVCRANPAKARAVLGWASMHSMPDVVRLLVDHERTHAHP